MSSTDVGAPVQLNAWQPDWLWPVVELQLACGQAAYTASCSGIIANHRCMAKQPGWTCSPTGWGEHNSPPASRGLPSLCFSNASDELMCRSLNLM